MILDVVGNHAAGILPKATRKNSMPAPSHQPGARQVTAATTRTPHRDSMQQILILVVAQTPPPPTGTAYIRSAAPSSSQLSPTSRPSR